MNRSISPLVSVVFTSYNHAEYLQQALDSILSQSFQNFELIVVDDCSTDGSAEILKSYSEIPCIKLHLLEKNTGSYVHASEFGARKAVGKYLLFAQCDDFAETNQLERLIHPIEIYNNVGVVFSRSKLVDKNGSFISEDYSLRDPAFKTKCKNDVMITSSEMKKFLSSACVIPNLSAALIDRELYFKTGGLPNRYLMAADWALWLEMTEATDFYYISEPLNNFRQHDATIRSKTKIDRQLTEIFDLFDNHVQVHGITGKPFEDLFAGFGNIWFTFFLEDPKAVSSSFFSVLSKTTKRNKLMVYFLIKGIIKKLHSITRNN